MQEFSENYSTNELEELSAWVDMNLEDINKDVTENQEKGIINAPKLNNGAVVFDYEQGGNTREIVARKEGNEYKIRVKKRINNQWFTQKNGDNETFDFVSKDKLSFNQSLGKILDKVIGNNRNRIPKTGSEVYDILNRGQEGNNNQQNNDKKTENNGGKKVENNGGKKVENNGGKRQKERVKQNGKQKVKQEEQGKEKLDGAPEGLRLDHGVYIYTVKKGDTLGEIKLRLQKYPPLSYLSGDGYGMSAGTGFNISKVAERVIQPGMEIPVPIEHEKRKKTVKEFKDSATLAVADMKTNSTYKDKINDLIKTYGETTIVDMMVAYAKSESSPDSLDSMIGHFALYRWEQKHNCASYGYYHILKEGYGGNAFRKLGMTVGQAFDPKNSGKLFLAYCCEHGNYKDFFDTDDFEKCAKLYNGTGYKSNNYDTKLKNNYDYVKGVK